VTVWIYVDARKNIGDEDYLKVFAGTDAGESWFEENDPEAVAFEYPVGVWATAASPPVYFEFFC
jgi:hypothetical protein